MLTIAYAPEGVKVHVRGGYYLTRGQLASLFEATERKREQLLVAERTRLGATRLLDSDYDHIAGQLDAWRERWLKRITAVQR